MPLTSSIVGAGIHTINGGGAMLNRLGLRLVSLDEQHLLDAARRATGLDDFGDADFREPLRRLLDALESEADLTLLGRIAAHRDLHGLLTNRLWLVEDRKQNPGIAAERIVAPIFIVGLPRTGSTALHHLLAQDPDTRAAQAWEVMYPSPPPTRATYETDPRIARAAGQLRWLDWLAPDFKTIHPVGARLPLECIAIMSASFLAARFQTTYNVPSYEAWLATQDMRPAYAFHRRFLQHLQWRAPGARWVLKAPSHVFAFDALLDTYPDARILQTTATPWRPWRQWPASAPCFTAHSAGSDTRPDSGTRSPTAGRKASNGASSYGGAGECPPSGSSTCITTSSPPIPWPSSAASIRSSICP
jgi:hypothetical protein